MLDQIRARIEAEIERLTHELTVALPKAIKIAVEHGDLRENADYKSALERQQFVQARINHLTRRMGELSKIDPKSMPHDRVGFGSSVKVLNLSVQEEESFTIVAGDFMDLDAGQVFARLTHRPRPARRTRGRGGRRPAADRRAPLPGPRAPDVADAARRGRGVSVGRILVIDDDPAMRGSMRRILERDGHDLREAGDGAEGLRLFRAEPADVVVTDVLMPGKEGMETIVELREEAPDVRILVVSGGGTMLGESTLSDAQALGADASLAKPFTVDQLRSAVAVLLTQPAP